MIRLHTALHVARSTATLINMLITSYAVAKSGGSVTTIARKTGVHRSTFSNYTAGRRTPSSGQISKIVQAIRGI